MTFTLSEQLDILLYEATGDDMDPDSSVEDSRVIKEDLIQFLSALGIEEGVDFCVDNEDIFLPPGVVVGSTPEPFGKKKFDKWPDYVFSYAEGAENIVGRGKGLEAEIPLRIFPLIELHSAK